MSKIKIRKRLIRKTLSAKGKLKLFEIWKNILSSDWVDSMFEKQKLEYQKLYDQLNYEEKLLVENDEEL